MFTYNSSEKGGEMNDSALVLGAFHFDSDHKLGAHYAESVAVVVCRLEMDLYFIHLFLFCFVFRSLAKRPQQDAIGDLGRPVMDSRRTHAASGPVSIRAIQR